MPHLDCHLSNVIYDQSLLKGLRTSNGLLTRNVGARLKQHAQLSLANHHTKKWFKRGINHKIVLAKYVVGATDFSCVVPTTVNVNNAFSQQDCGKCDSARDFRLLQRNIWNGVFSKWWSEHAISLIRLDFFLRGYVKSARLSHERRETCNPTIANLLRDMTRHRISTVRSIK